MAKAKLKATDRKPRTKAETHPVVTRQVPALAMRLALEKAGGDTRRIRVQEDGSVLVLNRADVELPVPRARGKR